MNNPIINQLSDVMNDRLSVYFGMLPPGEAYSNLYSVSVNDSPNNSENVEIVIECPDIDLHQFKDLRPHINRVLNNIYPHAKFEPISTGVFVAELPKSRLSDYSKNSEVNSGLSQTSLESLVDEATVRLEDLFDGVFEIEDFYYSKYDNTFEVSVKSQDGFYESSATISIDPTKFYDYETLREIYLGTLVRELEDNMNEV